MHEVDGVLSDISDGFMGDLDLRPLKQWGLFENGLDITCHIPYRTGSSFGYGKTSC
jgi:hypothetical protein